MSNAFVVFVCAIILLYGLVHALLMLISPAKHRRFNLRVSDPFHVLERPTPERDSYRGLELGYRLVGLAGIAVCILIGWGAFHSFFPNNANAPDEHATTPTIATGKTWWGLLAPAVFFLFGLYALLRPLRVYQWTSKSLPSASAAHPGSNQMRKGMQILGICFMALAIILFCVALRRVQ